MILIEKNSRIAGDLLEMHEVFISDGDTEPFRSFMVFDENEKKVAVRITAREVERLLPALEKLDFKVLGSEPNLHFVEGWLPMAAFQELETLADHGLLGVLAIYAPVTNVGSVTSQADFVHEADRVRASLSSVFDGTGVNIGALSDSYDNLGRAANDIATGDIPAEGVKVLEDLPSGGSDEGRAMLQLIHDLAPGASLSFATAFLGPANFADNIRALAAAGADIIVDDVGYLTQPFFQDGVVSFAVDEVVTENGAAYFSSAGNSANNAYESTEINFATDNIIDSEGEIISGQFYDFDPSAGIDTRQRITIPNGRLARIPLQWDDPFFTTDGVDTDIDVFLLDAATGKVVASSRFDSIVNQTPVEFLVFSNDTGQTEFDVVINLFTGPEPERIKYIPFGLGSNPANIYQEFATNSPTIFGHPAATNAQAVAAVNFFNQENPASFTSHGPTTILFDRNGNRLPTHKVLQTPNFAAINGTDTTFFGFDIPGDGNFFPNFFGTSAAAPHAAAVAALIKQTHPDFTPAQIYERLETTAQDIGDPGFDNITGFGLINAYDAIFGPVVAASLPFAENFEDGDLSIAFETKTTGAGRIQVTTENGPIDKRHVTLDSSRVPLEDNFPESDDITFDSLNELILHVDTTNFNEVQLSFAHKEFDDRDDPMPATFLDSVNADGVALSVDGTNWFRLFDLTGSNSTNTYQNKSINLSRFAADNGLILGSDVQIKFQQFGNGFATPGEDRGEQRAGFAFDNILVTEPLKMVLDRVTINENDSLGTLTGQIKGAIPGFENQLQIDFGDPNDNPDVRNFVLVDGGNADSNPDDGIIDFEITFDPPHQYRDDQALADGPSPGNDTPSDLFASATVNDLTSGLIAVASNFISVNNVNPIITEVMVNSQVIDEDNDNDSDFNGRDDDEEGLWVFLEGTFQDPGSLDIHTGTAAWKDGVSTNLEIFFDDGFNGTFETSRFLSEEELENFPEVELGDDLLPGRCDDCVLVEVMITVLDDDRGIGTKDYQFFLGEEGGILPIDVV